VAMLVGNLLEILTRDVFAQRVVTGVEVYEGGTRRGGGPGGEKGGGRRLGVERGEAVVEGAFERLRLEAAKAGMAARREEIKAYAEEEGERRSMREQIAKRLTVKLPTRRSVSVEPMPRDAALGEAKDATGEGVGSRDASVGQVEEPQRVVARGGRKPRRRVVQKGGGSEEGAVVPSNGRKRRVQAKVGGEGGLSGPSEASSTTSTTTTTKKKRKKRGPMTEEAKALMLAKRRATIERKKAELLIIAAGADA
jgi:hypothetical protein